MLPTYTQGVVSAEAPRAWLYTHLLAQCTSTDIQLTEDFECWTIPKGQSNSRLWFKFNQDGLQHLNWSNSAEQTSTSPIKASSKNMLLRIIPVYICSYSMGVCTWETCSWSVHKDDANCTRRFQCGGKWVGAKLWLASFRSYTPDGIVNCKCCGRGVLEIKCPYTYRYNQEAAVSEGKILAERNMSLWDTLGQ